MSTLTATGIVREERDFVGVDVTEEGGLRVRTAFGALGTGPLPLDGRRHLARLLNESAANEEAEKRTRDADLPAVVSPAGGA